MVPVGLAAWPVQGTARRGRQGEVAQSEAEGSTTREEHQTGAGVRSGDGVGGCRGDSSSHARAALWPPCGFHSLLPEGARRGVSPPRFRCPAGSREQGAPLTRLPQRPGKEPAWAKAPVARVFAGFAKQVFLYAGRMDHVDSAVAIPGDEHGIPRTCALVTRRLRTCRCVKSDLPRPRHSPSKNSRKCLHQELSTLAAVPLPPPAWPCARFDPTSTPASPSSRAVMETGRPDPPRRS